MDKIINFDTIADYNAFNNHSTSHPLVSVIDLSKANPRKPARMRFGFYTVFLKDVKCGDLRYGRHYYDYQEGTLVFMGPGQAFGVVHPDPDSFFQPKGYALVFHPDLLRGTSLARHINEYTFFSYEVHE